MKKILFFAVAIATLSLTSCVKDSQIYRGEDVSFTYVPTNLQARLLSVANGVATVALSNGATVNLNVLSPTQSSGDGFIVEAPIYPLSWEWDHTNNVYRPAGFTYNTADGFTANQATVYFVEVVNNLAFLFKKSVAWANTPNPAEWVSSFSNRIGSTRASMPAMGVVVRDQPNRYFFSR